MIRRAPTVSRTVAHALLIAMAAIWLFPLAAVAMVLVKDAGQFRELAYWTFPPVRDVVPNILENVVAAWTRADIGRYFGNSLLYATVAGIGSGLISSLAGYALVHLRVRAPQSWFMLLFVGNLMPFQMFLIPLYIALTRINLYDTRLGLILVYLGITLPFALFVYRNYALTVPRELFEAAAIDGASPWGAFTRVFLPITFPALIVVFVFQFTWTWNDLLFGLVLSESARPVMTALSALTGLRGGVPPSTLIAGSLIAALPPAIVLLALQRYFVRGFVIGIEKE